jgi:hypothetical protein
LSGGAITAAYFGLKKWEALRDFREKFLLRNAKENLRTDVSLANIGRALGGGVNDNQFSRGLDQNLFDGARCWRDHACATVAAELPPAEHGAESGIRELVVGEGGVGAGRRAKREISFNQGAEWNALISAYIGTIPLSSDTPCAAEHIMSASPPGTQVRSAMTAKVGAAARPSQPAAPSAAAWLRRPVSLCARHGVDAGGGSPLRALMMGTAS